MWKLLFAVAAAGSLWGASSVFTSEPDDAKLRALMGLEPAPSSAPIASAAPAKPAPPATAARGTESAAAPLPVETAEAPDPRARKQLVVALQQNLRRVGCYAGAIDGRWNAPTQRALARFAGRISPGWSTAEPDAVLLTLAEKYDNRACGTPCAAGSSPNAFGRCLPVQMAAANPLPKLPAAKKTYALAGAPAPKNGWAATTKVAALEPEPARTDSISTPAAVAADPVADTPVAKPRKRTEVRALRLRRLAAARRDAYRRWSETRYALNGPVYIPAPPPRPAARPVRVAQAGGTFKRRGWAPYQNWLGNRR